MIGKLERIQVFAEVAQNGSFVSAARKLSTSPSVITRMIAELEADLGVQLFVRTTRKVSLTLAGQRFHDKARQLLADVAAAEEMVRSEQLKLTGTLRVNAPMSFGLRFMATAVNRFRILHSAVDLRLDLTDSFIDIMDNAYDMALRISAEPRGKFTIWRKICLVPRVLVASPTYLARHGKPPSAAQLTDHNCLAYAAPGEAPLWKLKSDTDVSVSRFCFTCNNGDVLAELAALDEGITLLPHFIVSDQLQQGKLVAILEDWKAPEIWLTAYYPPYERLPAKVAAFTNFIEDAVAPELKLQTDPS